MTGSIQGNQAPKDVNTGKAIQNLGKNAAVRGADAAKETKSAIGNALNGKDKTKQQQDTGGVTFAEGTLKKIEVKEERRKNLEGFMENFKIYTASLTDGTIVTYEKQSLYEEGSGLVVKPQIVKNKDGSIDFIGLNGAQIYDTSKDDMYNLMGCSFSDVFSNSHKDMDAITFANIKDEHGNIVKNTGISVSVNAGDFVDMHTGYKNFTNGGYVFVDEDASTIKENIGNGRTKITDIDENYNKTVEYRSHDNKKLKESYVNAKEQVLADGYKIKTSPDGKEQWFFTPDGKQISKNVFKNRGLE